MCMGGYVHGYDGRETARLENQARTLEELLHADTGFPDGSTVLEAGCGTGAQTVALARRNPHRLEAGPGQQRVEPAPDHRVAARPALQLHLARNRGARSLAFGVEEGGTVVALDDGDRAAWPEKETQGRKCGGGVGQVFQHEAKENVIEGSWREWESQEVRLPELDVAEARCRDPCPRLRQRSC